MTTGKISLDEGTTTNTATNTITEDAVTKHIPRSVLNTSDGVEIEPLSESTFGDLSGAVDETAPVSDTADSGLNGRLQRIAQRLTSLLGQLPAALGQQIKDDSLAVTLASDQDALPVTDAGGSLTIDAPAIPGSIGQKARAAALGVTLSTEDVTALTPPAAITGFATEATLDARTGSLTETAPTTDTASSGLNGRLQRIAQRLTSLIALLPGSLGQKARASAFAVTLSTEDITALTPPAAITGFATESTLDARTGSLTETAPTTDTASSGLNGRLQRIAQRLTSLIALLPASLGQKARASALAVTLSTEDITALTPPAAITGFATESTLDARTGSLTETAPGTDTASSGLNGRLQRVAQRLTSLIALLPASLGQKARASALAVTLSTEDMTALTPNSFPSVGTGTKSNVSGSASSVTVLASNSSRKHWSVYNDSSAILYLDTTGGTASATSYTVQLAAGAYFEGPRPVCTNTITGIWASATGTARVVEFA